MLTWNQNPWVYVIALHDWAFCPASQSPINLIVSLPHFTPCKMRGWLRLARFLIYKNVGINYVPGTFVFPQGSYTETERRHFVAFMMTFKESTLKHLLVCDHKCPSLNSEMRVRELRLISWWPIRAQHNLEKLVQDGKLSWDVKCITSYYVSDH